MEVFDLWHKYFLGAYSIFGSGKAFPQNPWPQRGKRVKRGGYIKEISFIRVPYSCSDFMSNIGLGSIDLSSITGVRQTNIMIT